MNVGMAEEKKDLSATLVKLLFREPIEFKASIIKLAYCAELVQISYYHHHHHHLPTPPQEQLKRS